ncbi:hypothetical protein AOQ84DRAFT_329714 [Glonium stellatum]|uniref:Uncharacterized protein n=1 Tax=Glonium stellatum TaxID=574774 RepID=A0A8E2FDX4_9PEZI|nr:hypothetical protein AOQ84DRAFT_329714 [Glonium stellatum]
MDEMLSGAARTRYLLEVVPLRFYDFSRMDQFTSVQLADLCIENTKIAVNENGSVKESLLIFLDIGGQGSFFKLVAVTWHHDEEPILTGSRIFVEVLSVFRVLKKQDKISPSCPKFSSTKSR